MSSVENIDIQISDENHSSNIEIAESLASIKVLYFINYCMYVKIKVIRELYTA